MTGDLLTGASAVGSRPSIRTRLAALAPLRRPRRRPWPAAWTMVLAVYAASRVLTTGFLAFFYVFAGNHGWAFGSYTSRPGFLDFMDSWDGVFYRTVALSGYPTQLPLDAYGDVQPNAWAFLPIFPWLTRLLMGVTGLDFSVAGVVVAIACGAIAALLLHILLLPRVGVIGARWAVIFFCFGPLGFVLQVAYAESLFLVLVFASLIALDRRRYLTMIPLAVIAAFTHPGALALAAALLIHLIVRWRSAEAFPRREQGHIIVAGLTIAAAGFAWPLIAAAVTGSPSAYIDTELAWWTGYVGPTRFVPFTPWFVMAWKYLGIAGVVLVIALAIGFTWQASRRSMRVLGDGIIGFGASYAAYLLAVFLPQQSVLRLLLPFTPMLGGPVLTKLPAVRWSVLAGEIILQPVAIVFLWFLGPP